MPAFSQSSLVFGASPAQAGAAIAAASPKAMIVDRRVFTFFTPFTMIGGKARL
jgi:hypothetical protein